MQQPFDTALMRHADRRLDLATGHERTLLAERKAARRHAFRRFLAQVFAQSPRHPVAAHRLLTPGA